MPREQGKRKENKYEDRTFDNLLNIGKAILTNMSETIENTAESIVKNVGDSAERFGDSMAVSVDYLRISGKILPGMRPYYFKYLEGGFEPEEAFVNAMQEFTRVWKRNRKQNLKPAGGN